MITPINPPNIDISISDSLAITQAALNENILRMGKILTHFSGFTSGSFLPLLESSAVLSSAEWTVSLDPGQVIFPDGQILTHDDGAIHIPIQHYGTQYIIISHETHRATTGVYAAQKKPSDTTVYAVDKIVIRSRLGAAMPSISQNEMLVCRTDYSLIGDPVITDLRAPYSAYWAVPYSISESMGPVASVSIGQNMDLRCETLESRTMNTQSISRDDDSISTVMIQVTNETINGSISNARIEKVRGSSFTWEDLLFDSLVMITVDPDEPDEMFFSSYDFASHSDSYRIALTDAFQQGLSTAWSESMPQVPETWNPGVNITTVGSTAIIRANGGIPDVSGAFCMIWASESPIAANDQPIWIGPLVMGGVGLNRGARLGLTNGATQIHYRIKSFDKFGHIAGTILGTEGVSPSWPVNHKMIVLNIIPDITDEKSTSYSFSSDTHVVGGEFPFAIYLNPSNSRTIITKITFKSAVTAEDTDSSTSLIQCTPEGGSSVLLFTLEIPVTGIEEYEWEGSIEVPAGKMLKFFAGAMNRNQGHLYLEGYSL